MKISAANFRGRRKKDRKFNQQTKRKGRKDRNLHSSGDSTGDERLANTEDGIVRLYHTLPSSGQLGLLGQIDNRRDRRLTLLNVLRSHFRFELSDSTLGNRNTWSELSGEYSGDGSGVTRTPAIPMGKRGPSTFPSSPQGGRRRTAAARRGESEGKGRNCERERGFSQSDGVGNEVRIYLFRQQWEREWRERERELGHNFVVLASVW